MGSNRQDRIMLVGDLHFRTTTKRRWDSEGGEMRAELHTVHDPAALGAATAFMRAFRPGHLIYMGDMLDCAPLNRWDKDVFDYSGLQADMDAFRAVIAEHQEIVGDGRWWYLEGNHEHWLERYKLKVAMALQDLRGLNFPEMLGLPAAGIQWFPYTQRVELGEGVEVTHGALVSARSGMTALKELDMDRSGASGHTHRLAQVYQTTRAGQRTWLETGTLATLTPTYHTYPNWQQGFVVGHRYHGAGGERLKFEIVEIHDGVAYYAGEEYRAEVGPKGGRRVH